MTYRTKNATIVFAFAAVLLAWPVAVSTANADGGSGSTPVCTVTPDASIAMGNIVPGSDTAQTSEKTWATPGNVDGTVEITAQDWKGVGTKASAVVVLTNVIATDTITVNGQLMTAVALGTASDDEFDVGATDVITATNLAAKLTTEDQVVTIAGDDPTGESTGNVVIIRSNVLGAGGNAMTVATADTTFTVPASGTLSDGEADETVHAQSEMTKFNMGVDTVDTQTPSDYASKTALGEAGVLTVVLARSDVTKDIHATFQVSGTGSLLEALPYSGVLNQALVFSFTCVAE